MTDHSTSKHLHVLHWPALCLTEGIVMVIRIEAWARVRAWALGLTRGIVVQFAIMAQRRYCSNSGRHRHLFPSTGITGAVMTKSHAAHTRATCCSATFR